jgi:hypothetical protein
MKRTALTTPSVKRPYRCGWCRFEWSPGMCPGCNCSQAMCDGYGPGRKCCPDCHHPELPVGWVQWAIHPFPLLEDTCPDCERMLSAGLVLGDPWQAAFPQAARLPFRAPQGASGGPQRPETPIRSQGARARKNRTLPPQGCPEPSAQADAIDGSVPPAELAQDSPPELAGPVQGPAKGPQPKGRPGRRPKAEKQEPKNEGFLPSAGIRPSAVGSSPAAPPSKTPTRNTTAVLELELEAPPAMQKHRRRRKSSDRQLPLRVFAESQSSQISGKTCAHCDRQAIMVVRSEPRCSWHLTNRLPPHVAARVHSRRQW